MLSILSPAKTMKFDYHNSVVQATEPKFKKEALTLVKELKNLSKPELMELMSISENLADLNLDRFQSFSASTQSEKAAPALFAYRGDVYQGLDVQSMKDDDLKNANNHLRILTGLYGLLRPSDLIEAYRLEMGISLSQGSNDDLYEFWGDKLTVALQQAMEETGSKYLINLASKEYSRAIDKEKFRDRWYEVDFKEMRNGKLRFITFNAKKARGQMARHIIENQIKDIEGLYSFTGGGYLYDSKGSKPHHLLFVKPE